VLLLHCWHNPRTKSKWTSSQRYASLLKPQDKGPIAQIRHDEEAIEFFDMALEIFPQFSDAQAYKIICLNKLGKKTTKLT
jgi:hypothetical protein